MRDTVQELSISIHNLCKRYTKGQEGKAKPGFRGFLKGLTQRSSDTANSFYALEGLTVDIHQGDRIGIIGRNGAGKSTLLKLLSQVALPTEGEVRIKGRLTSLLEVGTGFEKEATGRANIYLNAGLYGLNRKEIDDRFDAIVAFSGVGEFLDTPVKRYSSGMYMRLAFSIAAHLDPDILLLDEVLAVGDIAFQQKCLDKIDDLTVDQRRTILFVSHSLGHVAKYCNKALWLDNGKLKFFGDVNTAIQLYSQFMSPKSSEPLRIRSDRKGTGKARLTDFHLRDANGKPLEYLCTGQTVSFVIDYEAKGLNEASANDVFINVILMNEKKQRLFGTPNDVLAAKLSIRNGVGSFVCQIDRLPLLPGVYTYTVGMMIDNQLVDKIDQAANIVVMDGEYMRDAGLPTRHFGDIVTDYSWTEIGQTADD